MRNRNFCCLSFVLVIIVVIIINYFFLKTSNLVNHYNVLNKKLEEKYIPISFDELQSDTSGTYKIWPLFSARPSKDEIDITIVTQTSINNLHEVGNIFKNWDGFVSIGIFAPGHDIDYAIKAILTLRKCNNIIKDKVFFTLVLTLSHPPIHYYDLSFYLKKASSSSVACPFMANNHELAKKKNYDNQAIPYPVNLLRNIALKKAVTSHVFVIDIDMSPSANLRQSFQNEYSSIQQENAVYVVPAFELKKGANFPSNKKELLKVWSSKNLRPFYESICWKCQRYTDYDKWRRTSSKTLSSIYQVTWQDPWEPFFIAERKQIINYDERFKQYGFNRISQVCETHIAGFNFHILGEAFIIHHGFKEKKNFHLTKEGENAVNRDLFRLFKQELRSKYRSSKRHC